MIDRRDFNKVLGTIPFIGLLFPSIKIAYKLELKLEYYPYGIILAEAILNNQKYIYGKQAWMINNNKFRYGEKYLPNSIVKNVFKESNITAIYKSKEHLCIETEKYMKVLSDIFLPAKVKEVV